MQTGIESWQHVDYKISVCCECQYLRSLQGYGDRVIPGQIKELAHKYVLEILLTYKLNGDQDERKVFMTYD